jgi:hypothetical protein
MKILRSKWTLLGCSLLLAVTMIMRWQAISDACRVFRMKMAWRTEVMRIKQALKDAGMPTGGLSLKSKGEIWLCLEGAEVRSVTCLSGKRINHLTLRDTEVREISPLEGDQLSYLDLRGSVVTNLEPIMRMSRLNNLVLSRQQILQNSELLCSRKVPVSEDSKFFVFAGGKSWEDQYGRVGTGVSNRVGSGNAATGGRLFRPKTNPPSTAVDLPR